MLENKEQVMDRILNNIDYFEGQQTDFDTIMQKLFNSKKFSNTDTIESMGALDLFQNDPDIDWDIDSGNRCGVWAALYIIKDFHWFYEETEFGEISTDWSDPNDVANMIDYIRGNTVFSDILDDANVTFDDKPTKANIAKVKEALYAQR